MRSTGLAGWWWGGGGMLVLAFSPCYGCALVPLRYGWTSCCAVQPALSNADVSLEANSMFFPESSCEVFSPKVHVQLHSHHFAYIIIIYITTSKFSALSSTCLPQDMMGEVEKLTKMSPFPASKRFSVYKLLWVNALLCKSCSV